MNDAKGIHYWGGWFVNNSSFGEMFRHIGKHRDPWTQEILTGDEKIAMTFDGVLDLLTLGISLESAALNQGLNVIIELFSQVDFLKGTFLEGTAIAREIYEMYSNVKELDPDLKSHSKVEFIANFIQLGLIVYRNGKFILNKKGDEVNTLKLSKKYILTYEYSY